MISKILSILINPMVWVIVLLFLALRTTNKNRRYRLSTIALFVFYFFGNYFTANIASSFWNYKTITVDDIENPYDLGMVLTGYSIMNPELTNFEHFLHFNQNANRLTQSIELYKLGKIKKLMICGGSGHLIGDKVSEGDKTLDFIIKMGIPNDDILIESKSRNTVENAQFAASFLKEKDPNKHLQNILLLTDNFHMYRAKKSFDKAGLSVVPFSLGNQTKNIDIDLVDFLPHPGALNEWSRMIREWAAVVVYRLMGYI